MSEHTSPCRLHERVDGYPSGSGKLPQALCFSNIEAENLLAYIVRHGASPDARRVFAYWRWLTKSAEIILPESSGFLPIALLDPVDITPIVGRRSERRRHSRADSVVAGKKLLEQNGNRPPVEKRVVMRPDQACFLRTGSHEGEPHEGRLRDVN